MCGDGKGLILEKEFYWGETLKVTSSKLDFEIEKKLIAKKLDKLQAEGVSEEELATSMRDFGIERCSFLNIYLTLYIASSTHTIINS